jgi:hypothetical protein
MKEIDLLNMQNKRLVFSYDAEPAPGRATTVRCGR